MHPELLNNPTFVRYYEAWQQNQGSLVFAPLADFLCQYKLFAEARKVCETGVKHNPNSVLAHYCLAKAYTFTREWHSARHEAQWVLARVTDHEGALDVLQKVEQSQTPVKQMMVKPERIVAAMEAAGGSSSPLSSVAAEEVAPLPKPIMPDTPKMTPKSDRKTVPWQTVTMAKIYAQQGHYFKARTIYKTILSRDPQNAEAQAGLATLEQKMRDSANG